MTNTPKKLVDLFLRRPEVGDLSLGQRGLVAAIYLGILALALAYFGNSFGFLWTSGPRNLLFVATSVSLVLGSYLLEPFFTRPADVLVNCLVLGLAFVGFSPPPVNLGRYVLLGGLAAFAIASFVLIVASNRWAGAPRRIVYAVVTSAGRSRVLFSIAYFYAVVSYFSARTAEFWILVAYLVAAVLVRPIETVFLVIASARRGRASARHIGVVRRRTSSELLDVACYASVTPAEAMDLRILGLSAAGGDLVLAAVVSIEDTPRGLVLQTIPIRHEQKFLLWSGTSRRVKQIDLFPIIDEKVVDAWEVLNSDDGGLDGIARKAFSKVVGLIAPGSTSTNVMVDLLPHRAPQAGWEEGVILSAEIQGRDCLLQVVSVESLVSAEVDLFRKNFWRVSCLKIGEMGSAGANFTPIPWIPLAGGVVSIASRPASELVAQAETTLVVGRVPGIDLDIVIRDPAKLVTHNTAILGALGTGKTSLAVRMASDVVLSTNVRAISIDVTNEHRPLFSLRLGAGALAEADATINSGLAAVAETIGTRNNGSRDPVQDPSISGNLAQYKVNVRAAICQFLFDAAGPADPANPTITGAKKVLVLNPEAHDVTRGEKMGFQVVCVPLSTADKTRVIAEELLSVLMKIGLSPDEARVLLLLEEAHTLIPEFSFAAQDGDRAAANGTARVILQGRKYGLGAFVIAQRTANVTKSVLSQCASVFALRIFDDTGKEFLSNFIGFRHSEALSQLQDHHAVVVGAGLGNEQAVMVELPPIST